MTFKFASFILVALAAVGPLASAQQVIARPSPDGLGDAFRADQYPSQRAALIDLAKQVAEELRTAKPQSPKIVHVVAGDGLPDATEFINALERELPDTQCVASASPTTQPADQAVAHVKLTETILTETIAPWAPKELSQRSGAIAASLQFGDKPASLTSRFNEKPWADDWASFVNTNPSHRWLTAKSASPGTSEAEAMTAARQAAADELASLVGEQMRARAARIAGWKVTLTPEMLRDQALSSLRRNVEGKLIRDVFVQRFNRPYGDVWQASVLVDASPRVIDNLVDSYSAVARVKDSDTKRSVFAVGGIVVVIVLLYCFLNAITKGYFMWRLRAAAFLMAIGAVLLLFARIGYS